MFGCGGEWEWGCREDEVKRRGSRIAWELGSQVGV